MNKKDVEKILEKYDKRKTQESENAAKGILFCMVIAFVIIGFFSLIF